MRMVSRETRVPSKHLSKCCVGFGRQLEHLPNQRNAIRGELSVGRNDMKTGHFSLGENDAIKGIFMVLRQLRSTQQ